MTTFVVTVYQQDKVCTVFCCNTQEEAEEAARVFESNYFFVTLSESEENSDDADFFPDSE